MRGFKEKERRCRDLKLRHAVVCWKLYLMDLVPDECEVCSEAEARRQEMMMEWTETCSEAVFCAELRSLT